MAPIKRKYRYATTQKGRQLNNAFYLTKMGCQIQICKTFFMNTIDINNRVIQTVVKKRTSAGSVEEDKRGKHFNHHKLPNCVICDFDFYSDDSSYVVTCHYGEH